MTFVSAVYEYKLSESINNLLCSIVGILQEVFVGNEYRVFGPPGTGKTTYLARNIQDACSHYDSDGIMVASFTRAAAREIASRDITIPEDNIGTLHAHCFRAMGSPKIAEVNIKEWNDLHPELKIDSGSSGLDDPYQIVTKSDGERLYCEMNKYRALLVDPNLWPTEVRYFHDTWTAWKNVSDFVDFTGMIEYASKFITSAPGHIRVGFFDEVQDFTPLEMKLVRKWSDQMEKVIFAGDDDQTIYGFKGAVPDLFFNPPLPDDHVRVLSQSYRLPRAIHAHVEGWVRHISIRQPKDYKARDFEGAVTHSSANFACPEPIVPEIERHISSGQSVMVLATCGYMLRSLTALLRREGIPFHNQYKRNRGDWNPLAMSEDKKSFSSRILDLLAPTRTDRLWTGEEFKSWVSLLRSGDILTRGAKKALDKIPEQLPISPRVLEDLFEDEALKTVIDMQTMDEHLDFFEKAMLKSKCRVAEYPMLIARKRGPDALLASPRVTVGTIHSVKGGEADHVYLFPDLSTAAMCEWHGASELKDRIYRLFYVGMTRARESLTLCSPSSGYYAGL